MCVRYAFTVSCCRSTHIDRPLTICAGVLLLHLPPGAYPVSTVPDLRRCPHLQITHTIDNLYLAYFEDHNFACDKCSRRHGWHGTLHLGFVGIDYRLLHGGVLPVLSSGVGAMRVWGRLFSLSVPPAYRLGVPQASGDNITALGGSTPINLIKFRNAVHQIYTTRAPPDPVLHLALPMSR